MKDLIIATRNLGKLKEIKEMFEGYELNITSLSDYEGFPEIIEDGSTFEENATIKAVTIGMLTGKLVMGEDSGIEIDALDGRPGVYTARYAGENATDEENNDKLLEELNGVNESDRTGRYQCCMALARGSEVLGVVRGTCEGRIAQERRGKNGFGYDPLFIIDKYNKTFGELDSSIKSEISHRAKALDKFKKLMDNLE